jgi:MoxR-like ATPase
MEKQLKVQQLVDNLAKAIVGKDEAIQLVLVALFSGGHALLEDVPGVGKTLLAKSLAASISGKFQRVQCTPDLLPTDITGTNIWNPQKGEFQFLPGPVFANVLLADEINRATPRTQSALLEVMEESQVTVDGISRKVPSPFFAIATQNPIEYQGTFPLPEAQELEMLKRMQVGKIGSAQLEPCITPEEVLEIRQLCAKVPVSDATSQYMINIVRATRDDEEISLGVSPRGTTALLRSVQSYAFIQQMLDRDRKSDYVLPDDVKFLAPYVLGHRIMAAGRRSPKKIIQRLLDAVPVP